MRQPNPRTRLDLSQKLSEIAKILGMKIGENIHVIKVEFFSGEKNISLIKFLGRSENEGFVQILDDAKNWALIFSFELDLESDNFVLVKLLAHYSHYLERGNHSLTLPRYFDTFRFVRKIVLKELPYGEPPNNPLCRELVAEGSKSMFSPLHLTRNFTDLCEKFYKEFSQIPKGEYVRLNPISSFIRENSFISFEQIWLHRDIYEDLSYLSKHLFFVLEVSPMEAYLNVPFLNYDTREDCSTDLLHHFIRADLCSPARPFIENDNYYLLYDLQDDGFEKFVALCLLLEIDGFNLQESTNQIRIRNGSYRRLVETISSDKNKDLFAALQKQPS